ncbi:hypothetical protein CCS01_20355 [Rhodopila globiformis]|uniref:Uncharacterized protein n=2 Tax=Rhodopila globiformis TaxID=1071 RepID=A0A2S6N5S6_RHOGL|nr:hypothetical protein CCS01_20355 [Rhodopila globiformis]
MTPHASDLVAWETPTFNNRSKRTMDRRTGSVSLAATACCLGFVTTVTWAIRVLPYGVSAGLFAWMLASLPIGILIGHCVLGDE